MLYLTAKPIENEIYCMPCGTTTRDEFGSITRRMQN